MKKYVYMFDEGNKDMKNILGGKGANLSEMTKLGLNVPSGFVISTDACNKFYKDKETISDEMINQIFTNMKKLEKKTNKEFGSKTNPLLVSVRSGSVLSMPGMMDTILNLGMNDDVINYFEDKRFAYDSYRRLIMMYSDVVMGFDRKKFENIIDQIKQKKNIKYDIELDETDMKNITFEFKKLYKILSGNYFPQDIKVQLIESVKAVFKSWNNERAKFYRKINNIPDSYGTAVNVQEMVYGNLNENSGTGVAFSRNPSTGVDELFGEYLINAQGEDVVAGIRTPNKISTLKDIMPEIYDEFYKASKILEKHYKDMQDIEFTIENKKLYILQTRNGKRTIDASIKIAVDLVNENIISKEEAILRVNPNEMDKKEAKVIAKGLNASPGSCTGRIYFNVSDIKKISLLNEKCILVRNETSPEDIEGMKISEGIITATGGMTSHAAVVARGMGKPCVSAVKDIKIDEVNKVLITSDGKKFKEGEYLSIDGTNGIVYDRKISLVEPNLSNYVKIFMSYVDEVRKLKVRTNAETKVDALNSLKYGAEGIGLVRTEHMFFDKKRIFNFRKMILSDSKEEIEESLKELIPYQREDFINLFKVMNGKPVIIRYLDPPLHEFLPKTRDEITKLALSLKVNINELNQRIENLKEVNPMMGHRGVRLLVSFNEIIKMQTRAVLEAAIICKKDNIRVKPEIMIPLVNDINEFLYVKRIIREEAAKVFEENKIKINYKIGTMIETVRAVLLYSELAKEVDFYSFGTNDLTQFTYGISRDDSKFLNDYYDKGIYVNDPFKTIDKNGVGKLIKMAIKDARKVNPKIEIGICGEQAGDFETICFCNEEGFDYVSCSPYRVLGARVSLAISELTKESK